MSQNKDDWIKATDGLFTDPLELQGRMRVQALAAKLTAEGLTDAERVEYLRLVNALSDAEE